MSNTFITVPTYQPAVNMDAVQISPASGAFTANARRATRRSTQISLRPSHPTGAKLKLKIAPDAASANQGTGNAGSLGFGGPSTVRFMQGYDRELDSDAEEPLAFEEHLILRMPTGPDCERLRDWADKRVQLTELEFWMKFKDSRRAVIGLGNTLYGAKLVDLPCIIESHKTLDHKHTFKVADICQMLLVDDWATEDENAISRTPFNIEDFIYPHGITPPLRHVRKRRFRKRLQKRTIETVERAVERLLEDDAKADRVVVDIVDNARDLSDSDDGYHPGEPAANRPTRASEPFDDFGEGRTPHTDDENQHDMRADMEQEGGLPGEDDDDDDEGSIDSDLAAEIEAGLMEAGAEEERIRMLGAGATSEQSSHGYADPSGDPSQAAAPFDIYEQEHNKDGDSQSRSEDDDAGLFAGSSSSRSQSPTSRHGQQVMSPESSSGSSSSGSGSSEDDGGEGGVAAQGSTSALKERVKLLTVEVRDLEQALVRKLQELSSSTSSGSHANPILRRRFEETVKRLTGEHELKKGQLSNAQNQLQQAKRRKKTSQHHDLNTGSGGATQD